LGSESAALKIDIYVSRMEELLNDNNTYEIVNKNPIAKKKLNSIL